MKLSLFQGILLGVFGIAAIIGLFVFALYKPGNTPEDIGSVVIWGALPHAQVDSALTAARRTDPKLKSVSYVQKSQLTLRTDIINAIAQGSAPDMVLISQEELNPLTKYLQEIAATNISERDFKTAFASISDIFFTPSGSGTYGVPWLIDPLVMFQNRTILSSAGIALPPATWEALTGLVPHVTTHTITGNISRALIALGTYANVKNARAIISALFLQAGVPLSTVSTTGLKRANLGTNQAQGGSSGEAVVRFFTQFSDPSKVSYTWNASLGDSQQHFLNGDSGLYLGFASEAGYFAEANPNLDFDVSALPDLAGNQIKTTYGLVYAFAIPRGSKNPVGALKAAESLTNPTSNQAAALSLHMAPAVRKALSSIPSDPAGAVAFTSALVAKAWLSPAPSDTDAIFGAMINNVISGRYTIPTALNVAESSLSSLLQQ